LKRRKRGRDREGRKTVEEEAISQTKFYHYTIGYGGNGSN